MVTERKEIDTISGCKKIEHHGKLGTLCERTLNELAWHFPVNLPDYDLNIHVYSKP